MPNLRRKPDERRPASRPGAADGAKQSFLAAMSHELRTPLNAIIGFAEIMDCELHGPMSVPQYGDYVRDILASSRRLLQIIEDVLEMSRAETGELMLAKREVDLRRLIEEATNSVGPLCRRRNIDVAVDAAEDAVVHVDPDKLRRAIASLLSNAVKFSCDDSGISLTAGLDARGFVTIAVKDRGIGIDAESIERAFAPFVQLDGKLSRRFEGSGLGLPLARLLVELHGGTVHLDSVPGAGTTATLRLPAYGGGTSKLVA